MRLLEQYEELVERSPSEISIVWKTSAIIAYFVSSLSAYTCAILFGMFWAEVCGGHCYLWSQIRYYEHLIELPNTTTTTENDEYDWIEHVVVTQMSSFYCNWFHFTCLSSAAVSLTFLTMFMICGKGGYDTTLFVAPWRLVLPALINSFIMMIMTLIAVSSFTSGYFHFTEKLYLTASKILEHVDAPFKYKRTCEVFQKFTEDHNAANYDSCLLYWMIQVFSWTMTWSWIGSFSILLMRILMSVDFNLLRVKIYALPDAGPERDVMVKVITEGEHSLTITYSRDDETEIRKQKERGKNKVL